MIFQEAALNIVLMTMLAAGLPVEDQELQADIYCGAQNIYFEAAAEPIEGMIAIGDVTINRKESTRWPDSICNVVWQDKQFSWTHDGKSDNIPLGSPYQIQLWSKVVYMFVIALLDEEDYSKCGTHYHNKYIEPWWADKMAVTIIIGNHKFLK
jgi:spore germination cell wall hydrolase CwlJ-like protein